jgi:rifampicin phosphotransferase
MNPPPNTILWPQDVTTPALLGGKAAALWRLRDAGFTIPPWFVVSPEAVFHDAAQSVSTPQSIDWQSWIPSNLLIQTIAQALKTISPDGRFVAFRSSGQEEDGGNQSFAGQFESVLGVDPTDSDKIRQALQTVIRSGFEERVIAYRINEGLSGPPTVPAVLVQRMVRAKSGGVAFSADPISGRRSVCVVCAVHGLGSALVGGDSNSDTFRLSLDEKIIERAIAAKTTAHLADPKGAVSISTLPPDQASQPAISDQEAAQIAHAARQSAAYFGRAQDIEWALEGNTFYLLQSRPITSLALTADPDGTRQVWDNSNIAESYAGITSPLTFTFARYVYEHVYRQFCLIMGVAPATVADKQSVFANMLGTARGRVYYNLLNWYRCLALLPGFAFNRAFMEQMMGVKEALPDDVAQDLASAGTARRFKDALRLGRTLLGLVYNHLTIERQIARFQARLDSALAVKGPPLASRRIDELGADYRALERELLTRWDAPLVNDFLAMIFFGTLRKLTAKWLDDTDGTLQNDLVANQGFIISAVPATLLRALAHEALNLTTSHPDILATLCAGDPHQIKSALNSAPALKDKGDQYIQKFGDRCMEELKLESLTLADDATPLWQSVGQIATRMREGKMPDDASLEARRQAITQNALARVTTGLRGHPIRSLLFHWVLRNARRGVQARENLRFERTRLFGRVRRLMLEIGKRMAENGTLQEPRDIFYLHIEEILGYAEGTATTDNLGAIAALRKQAHANYASDTRRTPDDRFETHGAFWQGNPFKRSEKPSSPSDTPTDDPHSRKGLGCCPGKVRGIARVIVDPRGATLHSGEILVAARTDPGWVLLFPSAAGVLVEHGSLLSHSAIVSRELGIPGIVSIPNLTSWLKSGDTVEFDGATGIVRKIDPNQTP